MDTKGRVVYVLKGRLKLLSIAYRVGWKAVYKHFNSKARRARPSNIYLARIWIPILRFQIIKWAIHKANIHTAIPNLNQDKTIEQM